MILAIMSGGILTRAFLAMRRSHPFLSDLLTDTDNGQIGISAPPDLMIHQDR
jgi:hypothetical protein